MERFEAFTGYMLQFNRYIQKIKEIEMQQFGLHATHTMCLYYLSKNSQGLTSAQLTQLCREDKAAISRCLKQLTSQGYVFADKTDEKRAYRSLLHLTEEGKRLAEQMEERVQYVLSAIGEGIKDEQREVLYETLEIIMNNFSAYFEKQKEKEEF